MAIVDLEALAVRARLMGLDVGDKTIGIALGTTALALASPLETIRRTRFAADAGRIFALADEHGVDALVIGLPINMDGSEGRRCQSVRQFAANLLARRDMAAAFWDERLSTAAVTRTMLEADLSRRKRASAVDRLAAAYILQGALDRLRNLTGTDRGET